MSATLLTPIPAQSLQTGQVSGSVSLANYFSDPTINGTAVQMQTPLGNIPILLTDSATPNTVANFLQYINTGEYANTIIHRSAPNFVIQGGGYLPDGNHITTFGMINGESSTETLHNTTGTIAMALSNGPNSATSEWFINLGNNPELDNSSDGGPFTVFGKVIYNGMNVANAIASLPIINGDAQNANLGLSTAWSSLPVVNYSGPNPTTGVLPTSNLVTDNAIVVPHGLTYTVQSSNNSIVFPSINNGILALTPGSSTGTANVTVTATDLGGGTATSTFAVNVGAGNSNAVATTTTLAAASQLVAANGSDTFTATVTPASGIVTPTGAVTFSENGTPIGTAAISGNTAVFTTTFATPETATISASYGGSSTFAPSTSGSVAIDVTSPPALAPTVAKSTLPAAVVAGKPVHGSTTLELTNATQATEKGSATINLFASADGVIDSSSVLVTTLKRPLNLRPGKGTTIHLTTKSLPATLANGTYTLLAQTIDASGKISDATSGPTIQVAAPFVSLSATVTAVKPDAIKLGHAGTMTVTLNNAGNIDSSGPATIGLGISMDGQTQAQNLANLSRSFKVRAGHSLVLHLRFVVPQTVTPGTYHPFISISQNGSSATQVGTTPITIEA